MRLYPQDRVLERSAEDTLKKLRYVPRCLLLTFIFNIFDGFLSQIKLNPMHIHFFLVSINNIKLCICFKYIFLKEN